MIAADLYAKLGRLSGEYVAGDYEDSDLCLRAIAAGRQNWYLADVALYHLEAQSYEFSERRQLYDRYNCWLHTHLWNKLITEVSGRSS